MVMAMVMVMVIVTVIVVVMVMAMAMAMVMATFGNMMGEIRRDCGQGYEIQIWQDPDPGISAAQFQISLATTDRHSTWHGQISGKIRNSTTKQGHLFIGAWMEVST